MLHIKISLKKELNSKLFNYVSIVSNVSKSFIIKCSILINVEVLIHQLPEAILRLTVA